MRFLLLLALFLFFGSSAVFSQDYFQQKIDYQLTAELDTSGPDLHVNGRMVYSNHSSDTLHSLIIHLWMDSFSKPISPWSQQILETGNRQFHFSPAAKKGGYRKLSIKQNGVELEYHTYVDHGLISPDIIELRLDSFLLPDSKTEFVLDYELRIPWAFDRPGFKEELFRMTQWYPKPAVYDSEGWHPMSYLSFGEFFSEFGDYKISLILPISFSAVATGQENEEASELMLSDRKRKLVFEASNVHDFAWFASDSYIPYRESVEIDGVTIPIHLFVKEDFTDIDKIFDFARRSLVFLSEHIIPYPYPQISLVQEATDGTGGMEYPMVTILDMDASDRRIDHLVAHELAHQWFYSLLASNERDEPWIDEGFASYYDKLYDRNYYELDQASDLNITFADAFGHNSRNILYHAVMHLFSTNYILPIGKSNTGCDVFNYLASNYARMATGLSYLNDYMGEADFQKAMRQLFSEWSNRHPKTEDLQQVIETVLDEPLDWFFQDYLQSTKELDFSVETKKRTKETTILKIERKGLENFPVKLSAYDRSNKLSYDNWVKSNGEKSQLLDLPTADNKRFELNRNIEIYDGNLINNSTETKSLLPAFRLNNFLDDPTQNVIGLLPHIFYNSYDGLMLGPSFYGSLFPQQKFRYILSPSFAFGSSEPTGFAALERDFRMKSAKGFRKLTLGVSGKRFNYNELTETGEYLSYWKLSPSVALHKKKGLLSFSSLEYRWMYVNQETRGFNNPVLSRQSFDAHQLNWNIYKARGLSVTETSLQVQYERYDNIFNEEKESYLRVNATIERQYYYNKSSRFFLRVFSSWFPHNTKRASSSFASIFTRGSVGISSQGFIDQFYEDLYFARSSQNSRQIHMADGGFKTAFGSAYNIGLTNDFMVSANLKIDLPLHIPGDFKIRPYLDYALVKTRQLNADPVQTIGFYSSGVAIELGEIFGLYLPIFNSSEISAGYSETGVFNRMSFKLNLQAVNPWRKPDQPGRFLMF